MYRPIIGIVGRATKDNEDKSNISTREEYRKAILDLGGIPILILPPQDMYYYDTRVSETPPLTTEEKEILDKQLKLCDGILLPGGFKTFEYDTYIVDYCTKKDKPILGICLGMQIMANYGQTNENGTPKFIVEKNDEQGINHCDQDKKYVHKVTLLKESKIYQIIHQETFNVNSFHKYHILKTKKYDIVGYSEDNLIEVIENKNNRFNIGVQWHPERLMDDPNQINLLKEFIKISKISSK